MTIYTSYSMSSNKIIKIKKQFGAFFQSKGSITVICHITLILITPGFKYHHPTD